MERLTAECSKSNEQRKRYEKRLEQGYPRNIPEERYLKLAHYEDLEEQGRLIELPAKSGDNVYIVYSYRRDIEVGYICGFYETDSTSCLCYKVYIDPDTYEPLPIEDFGKDWFLTMEEAEKKLKEMENE